ncbi:adenylate cyclase [Actinobaculum suis]|uniref:Adenylate cyclase n=2 Tax=Actinobaculum suis TaxID=1657 RepID=A0AAW9HSB5_9ACTO|nr:adenylate cyclase [Actinobaculum suis]MDY5152651.1 adenylate cyclase [Actinobaculum suis]
MSEMDRDCLNFEYERKFYVRELPPEVAAHGAAQAIVQAYLFAQDGYAVRIRVRFSGAELEMPRFREEVHYAGGYERAALAHLLARGVETQATVAVKSPVVSAERYEMEEEIDLDVAVQILRRSTNIVLKNRYALWYDEDGWLFDVFGGQNAGLIVAECERMSPVINLRIPEFCITEVSNDLRFTNDYLSKLPWSQWGPLWLEELSLRGPHFLDLRDPSENSGS